MAVNTDSYSDPPPPSSCVKWLQSASMMALAAANSPLNHAITASFAKESDTTAGGGCTTDGTTFGTNGTLFDCATAPAAGGIFNQNSLLQNCEFSGLLSPFSVPFEYSESARLVTQRPIFRQNFQWFLERENFDNGCMQLYIERGEVLGKEKV